MGLFVKSFSTITHSVETVIPFVAFLAPSLDEFRSVDGVGNIRPSATGASILRIAAGVRVSSQPYRAVRAILHRSGLNNQMRRLRTYLGSFFTRA
jgi:hypothetical protein